MLKFFPTSVLYNGNFYWKRVCWWKWCFYIHIEFSALLQNNTIIFDGPNRRIHFSVPTLALPIFPILFSSLEFSHLYMRFVGEILLYHRYSCCFMHVQWPNANLCVLWLRGNHKINIFYAHFHCFFDVLFQPFRLERLWLICYYGYYTVGCAKDGR